MLVDFFCSISPTFIPYKSANISFRIVFDGNRKREKKLANRFAISLFRLRSKTTNYENCQSFFGSLLSQLVRHVEWMYEINLLPQTISWKRVNKVKLHVFVQTSETLFAHIAGVNSKSSIYKWCQKMVVAIIANFINCDKWAPFHFG